MSQSVVKFGVGERVASVFRVVSFLWACGHLITHTPVARMRPHALSLSLSPCDRLRMSTMDGVWCLWMRPMSPVESPLAVARWHEWELSPDRL
jgi:hypothetical protein